MVSLNLKDHSPFLGTESFFRSQKLWVIPRLEFSCRTSTLDEDYSIFNAWLDEDYSMKHGDSPRMTQRGGLDEDDSTRVTRRGWLNEVDSPRMTQRGWLDEGMTQRGWLDEGITQRGLLDEDHSTRVTRRGNDSRRRLGEYHSTRILLFGVWVIFLINPLFLLLQAHFISFSIIILSAFLPAKFVTSRAQLLTRG